MNSFQQQVRETCAALDRAVLSLEAAQPLEAKSLVERAIGMAGEFQRQSSGRGADEKAALAEAMRAMEARNRRLELLVTSAQAICGEWFEAILPAGAAYGARGAPDGGPALRTIQLEG